MPNHNVTYTYLLITVIMMMYSYTTFNSYNDDLHLPLPKQMQRLPLLLGLMCLRKEPKDRKNPQRSKTKMELRKILEKNTTNRGEIYAARLVLYQVYLSCPLVCPVVSPPKSKVFVSLYSKLKN